MHAITYSARTGSPVLILAGDAPVVAPGANGMGPDPKRFGAAEALSGGGIDTFHVRDPDNASTVLATAVRHAAKGNAAVLLLPTDVQLAKVRPAAPVLADHVSAAPDEPREPALEAAAAILRVSKRPLFLVGRGATAPGTREAIEALAEKVGALLATTLKAKDLFRASPWNLGVVGSFSHSLGRRYIDQADSIVVFGAGLNQRTTSFGTALPENMPVVQVDTNRANIGRWLQVDVGIVGGAQTVAERLIALIDDKLDKPFRAPDIAEEIATFDPASDFVPASTSRTMDPRLLAIELDRLLPANRNVVWDAGNFLGIVPYLSVDTPRRFKMTADFASVGLGFGTALGYAKGDPGSPTVLMIGDGGLMMTLGELETVVREDIPLIIVLINDCAYGAELHYLKLRDMPVAKALFPDIDFAPIAEGFGFEVATIRSLDQLHALENMLANPSGPLLLDCKINADVQAAYLSEGPALKK